MYKFSMKKKRSQFKILEKNANNKQVTFFLINETTAQPLVMRSFFQVFEVPFLVYFNLIIKFMVENVFSSIATLKRYYKATCVFK